MWASVPRMGIGQRWEGEDPTRTLAFLGHGVDFVEPNLPLDLDGLLARGVPLITHSSEVAVASTGALNEEMVATLAEQIHRARPPWTGEHFALLTREVTGNLGYNAAPILDEATIDAGVAHARALEDRYGCPIALEAGPRYLEIGGWDDYGAILRVSERTGCGILIDLSHHLVSMRNLGRDPQDGLTGAVLERTVEIHVTGVGRHRDGRHYHDCHGRPVPEDVWSLLAWVTPQAPNLKAVTLEHDATVADDAYAADLARLRAMLRL